MPSNEARSELEKTMRLLALTALEGKKQKDQIALLSRAGFGQKEIAEILGSTPKAISVRLAELRREDRKS